VPKLHVYSDHVFVVLHTPELGRRGHVHYIELDQFIGRHYLVTVHGPINPAVHPDVALRQTREALLRIEGSRLRPDTPFELSHAIVSALTRGQEEFVETLTKDVWYLEQRLTGA
jgi:magnesium transporter